MMNDTFSIDGFVREQKAAPLQGAWDLFNSHLGLETPPGVGHPTWGWKPQAIFRRRFAAKIIIHFSVSTAPFAMKSRGSFFKV